MMGGGRPTKYLPEYCGQVVDLGKAGKSRVQIACALEVDPKTLRDWAEAHEEFSLALTRAKAEEQSWWEGKGQASLDGRPFNSAVWTKSMQARFREDYTERKELSGPDGGPIEHEHSGAVDELRSRIAGVAARSGTTEASGDAE